MTQQSGSCSLAIPSDAPEDLLQWTEMEIQKRLESQEPLEDMTEFLNVALDKSATHLGITVSLEDVEVRIVAQAYYFYLRLEPLGPLIDGNVACEGYVVGTNQLKVGPALAIVEKMIDNEWQEIVVIGPDKMMINAPEDANSDEEIRFMIPITVNVEEIGDSQSMRVRLFVKDLTSINYDDPVSDEGNISRDGLICCNQSTLGGAVSWPASPGSPVAGEDIIPPASSRGEKEEGNDNDEEEDAMVPETGRLTSEGKSSKGDGEEGEGKSGQRSPLVPEFATLTNEDEADLTLQELHIATDYDDVVSLQAEGCTLQCIMVTPQGIQSDQDFLWKFHIMGRYGRAGVPGIEDVQFIKCLKSLGTLPSVPFYTIMHDYDLSNPDGDYSVYLAFRKGPNPRFRQIYMVCCQPEHEDSLKSYVSQHKATFIPAPEEVDRSFPGICGLMLLTLQSVPTLERSSSSLSKNSHDLSASRDHHDGLHQTGGVMSGGNLEHGEDDNSSSDGDDYDEEDLLSALMEQVQEFESEKKSLMSLNTELQKKVALLLIREKALQGQTLGRTSADVASAIETTDLTAEQSVEKEKQYQDVLQLIVVERGKLNKQLKEFDQLALDLQTRLDDKEFKAKGIATSFKQFKQEILQKAQNSRTGHHLPEKQIAQIEATEARYEEELEKVRLRNISLRTTHKKLERTLRAREQLAEGLHMIDFEQLKIENQTLNEKIEERNEDLSKLKRKKTTTVQVLTHTREKLRFVEEANRGQQTKLATLENVITTLRNNVTALKLERDSVRAENTELKAKQSFASSDLLLSDFEKQKNSLALLDATVVELKHRYEILVKQVQATQQLNQSKQPSVASGSSWPLPKP
eukprot:gene9053-9991_t